MSDADSRESSPTRPHAQGDDGIDDELPLPINLLGIFSLEDAIGLSQRSDSSGRSINGDDDASDSTQADTNRRLIDLLSSLPDSLIMGDEIGAPESEQDTEFPAEGAYVDAGQTRTVSNKNDSDVLMLEQQVYPNQPEKWSAHHEYFLLTCNGTVQIIAEHLQEVFKFWPPLQESFVRSKLVNNARRQLAFLQNYLPGETHSMLRAEARIVLSESDVRDPDVINGRQKVDPMVRQFSMPDPNYPRPKIPPGLPPSEVWTQRHDNHLFLFLGDEPEDFLAQCRHLFTAPPTSRFVAVRMAQLPFLGLNVTELNNTKVVLGHTVVQRDGMFF